MKNTRIPALIPLCLAAMVSKEALALGLGSAELESRLGSPLHARIPLRSMNGMDPEELLISIQPVWDEKSESVIGGLKPGDIQVTAYRDEQGKARIDLSSAEPIFEPFLNFVVNVRWPQGSLSREYTLLLDLPKTAASFQTPPTVGESGALSAVPLTSASTSYSVNPIAPKRETPLTASTTRYTTQRGDSLWAIASRLRRERGGGQQRLMDQIYALNPDAFIRSARHLLKESVTLNIDPKALSSVLASQVISAPAAPSPSDSAGQIVTAESVSVERASDDRSASASVVDEMVATAPVDNGSRAAELTESLLVVSQEVEEVTQNIDAMSVRLAQLQTRLESLQQEYAQVQGKVNTLRSGGFVDRLVEDGVRGEAAVAAEEVDGVVSSVEADTISTEAQSAAASVEQVPPEGLVAETQPVLNELPVSESATARLWWLWAVAALAALWVVLLRRRRKTPDAPESAPLVTGKPPEPAPQHSPDAFLDVFEDLDGRRPDDTQGATDVEADAMAEERPESGRDLSGVTAEDVSVANTLQKVDAVGADGSGAEKAAACLALNDLQGARRILEAELQNNETESLKLMLLDIYARQGDASEFESLALQMEFAGVSDDALHEMEVLRKEMGPRAGERGAVKG